MPKSAKQIKIAVVDDHNLFRKCLSNFIQAEEDNSYYILFDASDGKDLIAQIDPKRPPDVVILDIDMPGMDGFETVEWLQKHHPEMGILVVSMIEKEEAIVRMIRLGVKGYLSKDIDPEELYDALRTVSKGDYHYTRFLTGKLIHAILKGTTDKGVAGSENSLQKWESLTEREREFVKLSCSEMTYSQIAKELFVAPKTVEGYRDTVFEKLQVKNRVGLVLFAVKNGYVRL